MKKISTPLAISIIVVLTVMAVMVILVYRHYLIPQQSSVPPAAKTLPTIMPTATPKDETANWKTYGNEKYGFEVKYPDYYQILTTTTPEIRKTDIYAETDASGGGYIKYRSKIISVFSLETKSKVINSYPDFKINIFPLDSYRFTDMPGGVEDGYDLGKSEWWENKYGEGRVKVDLITIQKGGWIGYRLGTGDAGYLDSVIAIPYKNKGLMLEFNFLAGPFTKEEAPVEIIFSTLKGL